MQFGGENVRILKKIMNELIVSLIVSIIIEMIKNDLRFNLYSIFKIFQNFKFYFIWFFILVAILLIRKMIWKVTDKKQDLPSMIILNNLNPSDAKCKKNFSGMVWEIHFDYWPKIYNRDTQKNLNYIEVVENVDAIGIYCPNDNREMKISRNYIGLFKYKCPKCKYRKCSTKNATTLTNEVVDDFKAQYR